jgi:hypothetical protein
VADEEQCPFREGHVVVYRPSARGQGQSVMTDLAALVPGDRYRIAGIVQGKYVVLAGFENSPTGGTYWTEFSET